MLSNKLILKELVSLVLLSIVTGILIGYSILRLNNPSIIDLLTVAFILYTFREARDFYFKVKI